MCPCVYMCGDRSWWSSLIASQFDQTGQCVLARTELSLPFEYWKFSCVLLLPSPLLSLPLLPLGANDLSLGPYVCMISSILMESSALTLLPAFYLPDLRLISGNLKRSCSGVTQISYPGEQWLSFSRNSAMFAVYSSYCTMSLLIVWVLGKMGKGQYMLFNKEQGLFCLKIFYGSSLLQWARAKETFALMLRWFVWGWYQVTMGGTIVSSVRTVPYR